MVAIAAVMVGLSWLGLTVPLVADAAPRTQVVQNTNPATVDSATAERTFAITDVATVSSVSISVTYAHPDHNASSTVSAACGPPVVDDGLVARPDEMSMSLRAPSGTVVSLIATSQYDAATPAGTMITAVFSDAAAAVAGPTFVSGSFLPYDGSFAALVGEPAVGDWTLVLGDDSLGDPLCYYEATLTVEGDAAIAPSITSPATATATVGNPIRHEFVAAGNPSVTMSYSDEVLPPGVTRSGDVVSAPPTAAGTFRVRAVASNGVGSDAVQEFTLVVAETPSSTTAPPTTAGASAGNDGRSGDAAPTTRGGGRPAAASLAFTGASDGLLVAVGLGLVLAGLVVLRTSRR